MPKGRGIRRIETQNIKEYFLIDENLIGRTKIMLEFTMEQWNAMPKAKKGKVTNAVRFLDPNGARKGRMGRQKGREVPDRQFIGAKTLKMGKRVLFEGIDFVISDYSLI